MVYHQEIGGCLDSAIGEFGLSSDQLSVLLDETEPILARLRQHHQARKLALLSLPYERDDIARLATTAARLREGFDRLVVLGTGGSSLGGRALVGLRGHPLAVVRDSVELNFLDNADPHSVDGMLETVDLSRTAFLVISKSGTTPETLAQTLLCLGAARDALGEDALARHFVVITEPNDNPLRVLAEHFNFEIHDHDPRLGGRFAALSSMGLLPALVVGLDGAALRAGAADVLDSTIGARHPSESAPAQGAALAVGLSRHREIGIGVLMPYADRLAPFGFWYRQLWAESLGKDGMGITPIYALGTVDQHSQLQLYLDGPRDKMFTLICLEADNGSPSIEPELARAAGVDYLEERTMSDLITAEARATAETLAEAGRPTRLLRLTELDEETLGALMMHFMIEVMMIARLLGVNPFTQPAVERGKMLAREYLKAMERS